MNIGNKQLLLSLHKIHHSIVSNMKLHSRNNQHFALNCTTPLLYILAPTCFGSSLPSSESFLDPSELLKYKSSWWYII
jgi:hypothetical protein